MRFIIIFRILPLYILLFFYSFPLNDPPSPIHYINSITCEFVNREKNYFIFGFNSSGEFFVNISTFGASLVNKFSITLGSSLYFGLNLSECI